MTLNEYIKRLQALKKEGYGKNLVAVADWNEQYSSPSVRAAEEVRVANHFTNGLGAERFNKTLVVIGAHRGIGYNKRYAGKQQESNPDKRKFYTMVGSSA